MVRSDLFSLIIRLFVGFIVLGLVLYLIFSWVKRRRIVHIQPEPSPSAVVVITPTPEVTPPQLPSTDETTTTKDETDGTQNQTSETVTYTTHRYIKKSQSITAHTTTSAHAESGSAKASAEAGSGWAEASASTQ